MKTTHTVGLIALLLLLTLVSCQEPDVRAPRYRLKKMTILTNYSSFPLSTTTITNYNYNASNQLTSTRTFTGSTYIYAQDDYYLTYNDAGLLTQSEWKLDPGYPGHTLNYYRRRSYTYDAQNRLLNVKGYRVVLDKILLEYEETYTYGTGRNPISGTRKNYSDNGTLFTEFTAIFTYNQCNVTQVQKNYTTDDQSYTTSYQYDDHPNPLYGIILSEGYSPKNLSKNNLLESGQLYTYNNQGLPVKKVLKDASAQTEYGYEYETY